MVRDGGASPCVHGLADGEVVGVARPAAEALKQLTKPRNLGPEPDFTGVATFEGTRQGQPSGKMALYWYGWGDRRNPAVLMLQGMSSHGWWGAVGGGALAQMLVAQGYYVVSFDNRDMGRSTQFPRCPLPGTLMLIMTKFGYRGTTCGYTLHDMAADVLSLLDALGIDRCHLIGHSMGGMVSQILAADHPDRVMSLTSLSSCTDVQGCPGVPQPTLYELWKLRQSPIAARYIDESSFQRWWDAGKDALRFSYPTEPHFRWDEDGFKYMFRRRNLRMPDDDANVDRQLHAIMCCPDRRPGLRTVRMPVLIAHGTADPVMPVLNAITTKENVPHAHMLLIPHMKHILPAECFGEFVDAFVAMVATCSLVPTPLRPTSAAATPTQPTVELETGTEAKLAKGAHRALLRITTR